MRHVIANEWNDPLEDGAWRPKPIQKRLGQWDTGFFVARRNNSALAMLDCFMRRSGFAEVVRENRETKDDFSLFVGLFPLRQRDQCITALAGMDKNVAFRMPAWVLRRANQGFKFGKVIDPFGLHKKLQPGRR